MKLGPAEAVVLVHGLWMNGWDMSLLRWRLVRGGCTTYRFSYPSVRGTPPANAERLAVFVSRLRAGEVHFVAHSLGGLVVRHLLHRHPDLPPGRIVTLGTPHVGSEAAERLYRRRGGPLLLGHSIEQGLLGPLPEWGGERELGSIAGSRHLGLGSVLAGDISSPSDGTVSVAETRLPGMTDHLVVRASHMGLVFSREAARQTLHFLRLGRFAH